MVSSYVGSGSKFLFSGKPITRHNTFILFDLEVIKNNLILQETRKMKNVNIENENVKKTKNNEITW